MLGCNCSQLGCNCSQLGCNCSQLGCNCSQLGCNCSHALKFCCTWPLFDNIALFIGSSVMQSKTPRCCLQLATIFNSIFVYWFNYIVHGPGWTIAQEVTHWLLLLLYHAHSYWLHVRPNVGSMVLAHVLLLAVLMFSSIARDCSLYIYY
jgi:hypothetical protein